jgi:hypothetical protein
MQTIATRRKQEIWPNSTLGISNDVTFCYLNNILISLCASNDLPKSIVRAFLNIFVFYHHLIYDI